MLAGFGHEPAITLAERLLALAPRQAGREPLVFYADNGSGVEVALKMAFQYFQNRGEPRRTRFIALGTATTAKPWARWRWVTFRCTAASMRRCWPRACSRRRPMPTWPNRARARPIAHGRRPMAWPRCSTSTRARSAR